MEINITNTDNLALSIILSIGNKIRTNGYKYDLIIPILYECKGTVVLPAKAD